MGRELMPEHLADLKKSGLNEQTIRSAGIYSITGEGARDLLGFGSRRIKSAMVFPYSKGCRLKLFPGHKNRKGKRVRYLQPKKSGNQLYVSGAIRDRVYDTKEPLYITEGEKKTLRAIQEGLCCVGLHGVWSWRQDGKLIADLKDLPLEGRKVILVPDSDIHSNPQVQEAIRGLWGELARRGARVRATLLPHAENGKVGLDDFLTQQSLRAFLALPILKHKSELPSFPPIYKQGEGGLKLVSMGRYPEPKEEKPLMSGLIAKGHVTTLYGDGGQGKSFVGMAFATAFASGRKFLGYKVPKGIVFYLDWELSLDQQQRRAFGVARGMNMKRPPKRLFYGSPKGFVTEILPKLRKEIGRKKPTLIVIDSAGLACGISPEAAEEVMGVYSRLVALGATCLLIDHQSKLQEGQTASHKTIFGSTYKFALSRSVLHIQKAPGSQRNPLKVRLQHKKNNFGPLHEDLGLKLEFSGDPNSVSISRFDLADDPDTRAFLPAQEKILDSLRREGKADVETLVKRLGLPERTVSNSLSKLAEQGLIACVKKQARRKVWAAEEAK